MPEATAHPYIPNSAPGVKAEMLAELDVGSVEELYAAIPGRLRLDRPLDLPPRFAPRPSCGARSRASYAGTATAPRP
jgi:hypothetical protein